VLIDNEVYYIMHDILPPQTMSSKSRYLYVLSNKW